MNHHMKIGENSLSVNCDFEFCEDGDFSSLDVTLDDGRDITDLLHPAFVEEIEAACRVAAEEEFNESKADAAIHRFESSRDEVFA